KLKQLKEKEKKAKRDRDKDLLQQIKAEIDLIDYKARRFFSGDRNRPDLLNTNLESVLTAVEHFHKENDINFALITDLTSFIDIVDILLIKGGEIGIVECKTGKVQKRIFDFLDYAGQEDFDVTKIDYSDKNNKFFDQVERTLKQMKKGVRVTEFLKKEEVTDPFSDKKIKVLESTNPQEYYFE